MKEQTAFDGHSFNMCEEHAKCPQHRTPPVFYNHGQNLSDEEVKALTGGKLVAGWYMSKAGQNVYICDGTHRDMYRGFRVLDIGGLK